MATRTVPRLSAVVISVIVPTYNEADSLPPLVERLGTAMSGHVWELVVVDDGSPDGTAEVANRLSAQHPVWVVRRAGKAGLASAVIAGFKEARGDILVVMEHVNDARATRIALRKALDDLPISKDVIVASLEEVDERHGLPWGVVGWALREGGTLYERA